LGGDDLKTTKTQQKQHDLTENKAIINELTSGAPRESDMY